MTAFTYILILWLNNAGLPDSNGGLVAPQFGNEESCQDALRDVRAASHQWVNGVCVRQWK